jgi:hypothetical protein
MLDVIFEGLTANRSAEHGFPTRLSTSLPDESSQDDESRQDTSRYFGVQSAKPEIRANGPRRMKVAIPLISRPQTTFLLVSSLKSGVIYVMAITGSGKVALLSADSSLP